MNTIKNYSLTALKKDSESELVNYFKRLPLNKLRTLDADDKQDIIKEVLESVLPTDEDVLQEYLKQNIQLTTVKPEFDILEFDLMENQTVLTLFYIVLYELMDTYLHFQYENAYVKAVNELSKIKLK